MLLRLLFAVLATVSAFGYAAEISLLTAGFSSEKQESAGNTQKQNTIELGGRYHEKYDENIEIYYLGILTFRNFSEGSDSNGIEIGAGARYYGRPYSNVAKPYLAFQGFYKNDDDKIRNTKTSGLFYSGLLGMRFELTPEYFFDLEGDLFSSSLISTQTTTVGNVDSEISKTEIRVSGRNDTFFN